MQRERRDDGGEGLLLLFEVILARLDRLDRLVHRLLSREGIEMADLEQLKADVAAESAEVQAVVDELARVDAMVADLSAKLAAGEVVTAADIDALDAAVKSGIDAQTAAVAASQAATPSDPAPSPDPTPGPDPTPPTA